MQIDHYSIQAEYYAKYRPTYPPSLFKFIYNQLEDNDLVWDCATGTGQVAAKLANHFQMVFGTDLSEGQLKNAIQKSNIEYHLMPAEKTTFLDDSFDLVTVAQAIHWFNMTQFFEEVKRTLKPNGVIAVIGYDKLRVDEVLNPIIEGIYSEMFGDFFDNCRQFIYTHYSNIPFPFEEIETPKFEIKAEWDLNDLEGFFHSWAPVQKVKNDKGIDPVPDFFNRMRPHWGEGKRAIHFPIFLRLGRWVEK
ncbi:MAG: class I SAM-dependent methyltransferase [Saprospiraceae bacterium]|nr:class I SAM-dependent methyltransferase [Saprospiraceae bacterium]